MRSLPLLSSRLLKACGSRLTEKLLEGAPTEDTLVLKERQTGRQPLVEDIRVILVLDPGAAE